MKTNLCLMIIAGAMVMGAAENNAANEVSSAIVKVTADNTAFAADLYQQLRKQEGNLFFSPYSISTALAMTYGGARGKTADEMAQTLHFEAENENFHEDYGKLIARLNEQGEKDNYKLLIANALWGQKDFRFLDPYLNLVKHNYDANLELVDYVTAAEAARQTINTWVEDKTEEKIKNLIPAGALDAQTRLVLTNAIYFKGDWAEQFDKTETKPAPFYISAQETVQAQLMHRKGEYKYTQGDRLQVLQLPYKGDELSMLVLLPEERGTGRLEEKLSAATLNEWTKNLRQSEVDVYLPKFKMNSRFELGKVLAQMGMPLAFSGQADFSGMTGGRDLFISQVIHKAFVDVNEEGTEAAAATGVVMRLTAAPMETPEFRADRPFIFVIKDNATGAILFMGRVANPTVAGE